MSSSRGQDGVRSGDQTSPRKRSVDPTEVAGSPDGSQASQSSSTRRSTQRIVELLPELISRQTEPSNAEGQDNWMIRAEFYHEDIGAEDERMSLEIADNDGGEQEEGRNQDLGVDADDLDEVSEEDYEDEEADYEDYDDDDMGFVLAPANGDSDLSDDDDSDDDDEDYANDGNGTADYDTTLPIGHRYLGDNFQDSGGTQIFVEHTVLNMPLFNLGHIVPLPGQLLPIRTTTTYGRPNIHESLRDLISRGTTLIGLMSNPRENQVGTTAEIRSYCHEGSQGSELTVKLEGRQRFQLLSQPFETTVAVGTVKILPEIRLGRPYLLPPSRRRLLLNKGSNPSKIVTSRHPLWVLEKYEISNIVSKVLAQIQGWYPVDLTMRDPDDLSYWVAANLPLSNQERMCLLKFNCTEQRLLWLLDLLERSKFLCCANCGNVIGNKALVFAMSCSGPQTSFVNEGGFVHDTLTVRRTQGLIREVEWSTAFCWFPGYKWSIVSCDTCNYHIGWCYKSLTPDTRPRKFFGLSRANVRLLSEDSDMQVRTGE